LAEATAVRHEGEVQRLQQKISKQQEALGQAKGMIRRVHAEMKRLHHRYGAMGAERWVDESPRSARVGSFQWQSRELTEEESHQTSTTEEADVVDESYDLGAELGLDDTSTVDASFYGSGISMGLQSGDEGSADEHEATDERDLDQREPIETAGRTSINEDATHHERRGAVDLLNSRARQEVSRVLGHVGSRVDPELFDAEPWA